MTFIKIDRKTYYRLRYGRPLVQFDLAAEARLRLKIDLYIVPTVALLYLFCFIDRASIGQCCLLCRRKMPV
jgi:hypothetical protein